MSIEEEKRLRELCDAATPGPWRVGSVEKYHIYIPHPEGLAGPGGERVLLRFNEHFVHAQDAAFIAAARTTVPALLDALTAERKAHEETRGRLRELEDGIARLEEEQRDDSELTAERAKREEAGRRAERAEAALAAATAERDRLRAALMLLDPRKAGALYERIADDFYAETRLWPPGRSRPPEMGPDPREDERHAAWGPFVDGWHERFFDEVLAAISPAPSEPGKEQGK